MENNFVLIESTAEYNRGSVILNRNYITSITYGYNNIGRLFYFICETPYNQYKFEYDNMEERDFWLYKVYKDETT